MRLFLLLSVVLSFTLICLPVSAQVIFQDDFESGLGNWTVTGMTSGAAPSSPIDFGLSAGSQSSADRIYHNLGVESSTSFRASWWLYDDGVGNTRAFGEMRGYTGAGFLQGSVQQVYAAGKYNGVDSVWLPFKGTKYQGRVMSGTQIGWFNLDASGSPNRSVGWHKFAIEASATGAIRFYVDGILSRTITGATVKTMDCVVLGLGLGTTVQNSWYDGVVVENSANKLALNATTESLYVRPGEPVQIHMDVSELTQPVNSCQAMLGYSSTYLYASSSCVAPGGGPWDLLIYNSWDVGSGVPGEIDAAIGVNAQGMVGTQADGTVAIITLTPTGFEGVTQVVFRPDAVPDPGLLESTFLSNLQWQPVWPFKSDSQEIIIDGTPPAIDIIYAKQNGTELLVSLGSTTKAVQGRVDIQVDASDQYGLPAAPAVNVWDANGNALPAVFDGQIPYGSGEYFYHVDIPAGAANGQARIRAKVFDKAGNSSEDNDYFQIDKNQITGQVELDGFIGAHRQVVFTATDGATVLKTWAVDLNFTGGTASFTLTEVPNGIAVLTADTNWSLRGKLDTQLDSSGQATANFTGADMLFGGDLNGDNFINIQDYAILKSGWYLNTVGDINGNGSTELADYTILKRNFFLRGE